MIENWWYCDNIVSLRGYVGLLHLGFPRLFILFRDEEQYITSDFESWKEGIAEINFLDPNDRETADLDSLLTDAWNFAALQEAEEDRISEEQC